MKNSVLCYLEETAERTPHKVAFLDGENEISFGELREKAIDLARHIENRLKGRRNPILVYLPKTVSSIVSFMGVLYSGNFYTPTDVRFPEEKIKGIIDVLMPSAILVNNETETVLKEFIWAREYLIINIDEVERNGNYQDGIRMVRRILDVDPVYVFFTSGSTGVPKGVIINNHNVIDYIDWAVSVFPINEKTIMGNQSPFYFDISTQDIYATLKTGATLAIIPPKLFAFPVQVLRFINDKQVNFLYWVPSAFVSIANYDLLSRIELPDVETIMFGGEVMPVKQLNYWKKWLPNLRMVANVYGPTEATVNCTYYILDREFDDSDTLPLGKACENTGLIVLDDEGVVVGEKQIGKQGELCVYGSSLSIGYWGDAEKTNERFINNPLNPYYGEKMYLTGDLVCYNKRGELEFIGRKDFQIKHLGYRIELGEIESAVMGLEAIKVCCADYDKKNNQIVLFYSGDVMDEDLQNHLLKTIPKYMVPTAYFEIKMFPYNDNGKIDRKLLRERYIFGGQDVN